MSWPRSFDWRRLWDDRAAAVADAVSRGVSRRHRTMMRRRALSGVATNSGMTNGTMTGRAMTGRAHD
jgi:hypothetical protein